MVGCFRGCTFPRCQCHGSSFLKSYPSFDCRFTREPVPALNLPPVRSSKIPLPGTRIEKAEDAELMSFGGPWKAKRLFRGVGQETTDGVLPSPRTSCDRNNGPVQPRIEPQYFPEATMPLAEQSRPLCLRRRQKLQKLQVTEVAIEAQRHTKAEAEEPAERGEVRPNRNTDFDGASSNEDAV